MIKLPEQIPGLRTATWLVGAYAALWISLEGALWRSLLLAAAVTLLTSAYLAQRRLAGRALTASQWLVLAALWGATVGLGSGLLTLLFMSLKTGLHAHGPEFSLQEIDWVVRQIPLWSLAGLSAGAGLGLILLGRR